MLIPREMLVAGTEDYPCQDDEAEAVRRLSYAGGKADAEDPAVELKVRFEAFKAQAYSHAVVEQEVEPYHRPNSIGDDRCEGRSSHPHLGEAEPAEDEERIEDYVYRNS